MASRLKANQTKVVAQPEKDGERQPAASNVVDLMDLLKKSIDSKKTGGKNEKPAAKPASRKAAPAGAVKKSGSAKRADKEHRAA